MSISPVEINFIKQDIRDLQKKLDSILKRLDHVESNTVVSEPAPNTAPNTVPELSEPDRDKTY